MIKRYEIWTDFGCARVGVVFGCATILFVNTVQEGGLLMSEKTKMSLNNEVFKINMFAI